MKATKTPASILGLTLEGGQLEAVVLRRTNGSAEIQKTARGTLSLDLLRNEPELVGREIRKLLDASNITEKRCAVSVPLAWAMTQHSVIPPIDDAELADFLQIEAERGFARSPDELQVASTIAVVPDGARYAAQVGIPKDYLARLEAILTAARLVPCSLSLGITALGDAGAAEGSAAADGEVLLLLQPHSAELLVSANGGIAALRVLEGVVDSEGSGERLQTELIARELRITLGQLPSELRAKLKVLNIAGTGRHPRQLADELQARIVALGLRIGRIGATPPSVHRLALPGVADATPAICLAARFLSSQGMGLEFLQPKPTLWARVSQRYSSKRLAGAGAVGAAAAIIAAAILGFQHLQLSSFQRHWSAMSPKVTEIEDFKSQIRKFRPWTDNAPMTLKALKRLSEAFPEEGSVSAKMIEINSLGAVTVNGVARDNANLLRTHEKLRGIEEIRDLKVGQIRGANALQFNLNYRWVDSSQP